MAFTKTPKQIQLLDLISNNTTTLAEGGGRSGKTAGFIYAMVVRAAHYPNTWHLAVRLRASHAKMSLWNKTIPDVLRWTGLKDKVSTNKQEMTVTFPHGNKGDSKIIVAGLDDKDRVEKVLGNEYATIFINEASQIVYDSYEMLGTRLNAKGVPLRVLIDYNPPSTQHWGYKIFHKRKFPDGREVPKDDYAVIKMNPSDNIQNISEQYIKYLETLSISKRKRFLMGEYGTDEGSLWKREWINYKKQALELVRVVVGVDPSGSVEGDEIGIIVVAQGNDNKKYVLADYSLHGTPQEWSSEVIAAYDKYQADCIVAEKNYGGDMVEATITQMGTRNVNVELVTATRGKVVRAEPISAMYERGEVFHVEPLMELEDELCTWKPLEDKKSPNRLDALVWALTNLSSEGSLDYV